MSRITRIILIISLVSIGGLFFFNSEKIIKWYKKRVYVDPKKSKGPTSSALMMPITKQIKESHKIKEMDVDGWPRSSTLMIAIKNKEPLKKIKKLITEGADVNAVFSDMFILLPVLRYALDRGTDEESVKIIKLLIQEGASVNNHTYNRVPNFIRYGMMPLLNYAVIYSSPDIVQLFVDAGANPNKKLKPSGLENNLTALELAYILEKPEIVQILIKAGAEGSKKYRSEHVFASFGKPRAPTMLMKSLRDGVPKKEIELLITKGADVNAVEFKKPDIIKPVLWYALDRSEFSRGEESVEIIKLLIQKGADVNALTFDDKPGPGGGIMSLLHYALSHYYSPEIIQLLVDAGADVNKKFVNVPLHVSKTPLKIVEENKSDYQLYHEYEKIIQILTKAGAHK